MLRLLVTFILLFSLASGLASATDDSSPPAGPAMPVVDLHAHLFFYEGMGLSLLGDFKSPIHAGSPTSSLSRILSKVNADTLEASGAGIVVVALYAHPLFLLSYRDSIRAQIHAAEEFVSTHPDWAIARSQEEASRLLGEGKRILIFSLEGANGVLETEADLKEFIDRDGIRIVTPVHFTDDHFGGACLMPGIEILTNPWAAFKSLFNPHRDRFGARTNPQGLKPDGEWLIKSLLRRGVWIDLSHTSDGTYRSLLPLLEQAHQPLLYTHTVLRSHFHSERGITPERLDKVRETGGIVGLLPSDDMLEETVADPIYCPRACGGTCDRGIPAFLTQYSELANALGDSASVMIGSDIDAPLNFLEPACPAQARAGDSGLSNYGQIIELWKAARRADLAPAEPEAWAKRFLYVWSKVQPH